MTTATRINLAKLAAELADANQQLKQWQERKDRLAAELLAAHAAGNAPTKFDQDGWSFQLQPGRRTVVYPPSVVAELKMIQSIAEEAGLTTEKIGTPFWRITTTKGAN